MKDKYTIGLDYGTLSGRGVLVRCKDGKVVADATKEYTHGVMDEYLFEPENALPVDWCLEHPMDYIEVLEQVIPALIRRGKIDKESIIGIGVDFTASTVLPIDENAVPLCAKEEYKNRRNAYVKLWKHHGAQKQANEINDVLEKNNLSESDRFGGSVSPELMVPKAFEILQEDLRLYEAAAEIIEAGDWITRTLTGSNKRSCSMAGYKMWWSHEDGYPTKEFFKSIDRRLADFTDEKLPGDVCSVGESVGNLSKEWAERLGLKEGIAVAAAVIDSHAGFPGSGVSEKGQVMLVLGTSSVMITLSDTPYSKKGVYGAVRDGIVPGYYALESGIAAVGDLFEWFVKNMVPQSDYDEADAQGIPIHALLSDKAGRLKVGESGLIALDWWNGNKTPYVNGNLSGAIMGMTLNTKPEEIYRALIEATAFGTRTVIELFKESGIELNEVIASGGISLKNPLVMQIYADVLGIDIKVAKSNQAAALGSAIYASLAAGERNGGYNDYALAVQSMTEDYQTIYHCNVENKAVYNELFEVYTGFCDVLGDKHKKHIDKLYELKAMCKG